MKSRHLSAEQSGIPSIKEWSPLLLRFTDTYIYYYYTHNLLPFCSGSPTPVIRIILRMTLTIGNDNNVIVYALDKLKSYARNIH